MIRRHLRHPWTAAAWLGAEAAVLWAARGELVACYVGMQAWLDQFLPR